MADREYTVDLSALTMADLPLLVQGAGLTKDNVGDFVGLISRAVGMSPDDIPLVDMAKIAGAIKDAMLTTPKNG